MFITQIANWTADMWGAIIGLFSFIPSFGWMIILFTVCLKLLLSPLDFWQRKVSRQTSMKQAVLQPEIQKLQKKFANNRQMLNQKTQELYKRENFNMAGSCVSMLVNMALTLFIFITLFYALMGMTQVQMANQYTVLQQTYNDEFKTVYTLTDEEVALKEQYLWAAAKTGAEDEMMELARTQAEEELGSGATPEDVEARAAEIYATYTEAQIYNKTMEIYSENAEIKAIQQTVLEKYNEIREGWLWVSSVWRPDTNASAFPNYADYVNLSNFYNSEEYTAALAALGDSPTEAQIKELRETFNNKYNFVTYEVQKSYSGGNGYFILVILAALVTFLSVTITQRQTTKKKDPNTTAQPGMNATKIMKFILPAMMVIFTISYSAAFAIYIVTNSIMATLLSFIFLKYFEHKEKKQKVEISDKPASTSKPSGRPDYSR